MLYWRYHSDANEQSQVRGSQSRSGFIQLHAQDGVLKLPSGRLNADALGGNKAGNIVLTAKTIETEDGTIISASQEPNDTGSVHQIVIAAEEIKFKGTDGLKILADGNGVSQSPFQPATVYLLPKGGIVPTSTGDATASPPFNVFNLEWTTPFNGQFFEFPGKVHFNGEGSAPLLISNNGDHTQLAMTGYPLNFSGGAVTIRAKGNTNHQIVMGYFGAYDGTKGISFDNTGRVRIDANSDNGTGGRIQIQTDKVSLKAIASDPDPEDPLDPKDVVIKADNIGTVGDGGRIAFVAQSLTLDQNSSAKISANGAMNGVGNANNVDAILFFVPSAVNFGKDNFQFKLTANGGFNGGNGGAIEVNTLLVLTKTKLAIQASAGAQGNGGRIKLNTLSDLSGTPTEKSLEARGGGSGEGGRVELTSRADFLDATYTIDVEGGSSLSTSDGKDGFVQINSVGCQRYKVRNGFPKSYWNCVNPNSPTNKEKAANDVVASMNAIQQDLKDAGTEIFVMNRSSFNSFWRLNPTGQLAGYTFKGSSNRTINVNVFPDQIRTPLTREFVKGASAHEIGHVMDFVKSEESLQPTFVSWVDSDLNYLDFTSPWYDPPKIDI